MSKNVPCAKARMTMSGNESLDVAVSWDASMIALLDISPVSPNKMEDPPSSPGMNLTNELFVTCDGKALDVYSPFKQWSHLRRIPLDIDSSLGYYDLGAALSKHLRGSHLALASWNEQHVAVWNIEKGALVSFMERSATNTFALSSDGLLMAFARRQHIGLHSATTETMIGACPLEELTNSDLITGISFIEGDK
ncbi:hypothetical protein BGZ47_010431 [Haplosporangium gracile]|nr:hypothetical protein BGZ47_010431 [Haplosporangium gracile]